MKDFRGDLQAQRIYNTKIREHNSLRTDDIDGASPRKNIIEKSFYSGKYNARRNALSQSVDLKRNDQNPHYNPITHNIFHDFQGKRPEVQLTMDPKLYDTRELRFGLPTRHAQAQSLVAPDFTYNFVPAQSTKASMYRANPVDSLDYFQNEYHAKRGYDYQSNERQYEDSPVISKGNQPYQQPRPQIGYQDSPFLPKNYQPQQQQQQLDSLQANFGQRTKAAVPVDKSLQGSIHNFFGMQPDEKSKGIALQSEVFQKNTSKFYDGDASFERGQNGSFQQNYENFFRGYTPTKAVRSKKAAFQSLNNSINESPKKEIYRYDPIKGGAKVTYQPSPSSIVNKANDPMNIPVKERWALQMDAQNFF